MESRTLNDFHRQKVVFDPTNPEHMKAFKMLVIGEGPNKVVKHHPTIRFQLEFPYASVRDMLMYKVCEHVTRDI